MNKILRHQVILVGFDIGYYTKPCISLVKCYHEVYECKPTANCKYKYWR